MPIRRVELGNELYDHAPLVDRAFPTPAAYGRKASRWIRAIKRRFPHARVAAVGLGSSLWRPPRTRRGRWDPAVLRTLRGEDALTFHAYWTPPAGRLSHARLSKVLAAPLRRLFELRAGGLRLLPDGVVAWVTEWNVWHGSPLRGTWANGLADAEYLLALLGEPRVRQEDLHPLVHRQPFAALFGNPEGFGADEPPTVPFAPTAVGRTSASCIRRCRAALACVSSRSGRSAHSGHPNRGHAGGRDRGSRRPAAERRRARRRVQLDAGPACDGTLDSIWARPSARITGHAGEVRHQTIAAEGPLALPPYSVNRLDC